MENLDGIALFTDLGTTVLVLSLSALRVSVAFVVLPLFSNEGIPPLVRNALYVSLALISIVVQPVADFADFDVATWSALFAKEAFLGVAVGVFFGLFLWAFEAAGVVIDMQIGASFALFFDPIVGNEVTLIGAFLGRWANYLFVAAGGLTLMTGALLESFVAWPLVEPIGGIREASVRLFEAELSRFMSLTIRIAGPIMVVIFAIDVAMGLINRYAQQFNVFFLSMSIKSMAAAMLLIVLLPFLADLLLGEVARQAGDVAAYLERVLRR